jgi:hypothetical protein
MFGVGADPNIVPNVYLVIQLDPIFDHRILDGTAIDGRIGPNFDIVTDINAPELRDLQPTLLISREPKTVCADHSARMNQSASTDSDPAADSDIGYQVGEITDPSIPANHASRAYDSVCTNRHTLLDNCQGADCGARVHIRVRSNPGRWVQTRFGDLAWIQQTCRPSIG